MASPELSPRSNTQDILKAPMAKFANGESPKTPWSSISSTMRLNLSLLRPSFLGRHQIKKPRRLHATSYLDGLRGVAALFVVFNHYVSQFFPGLQHGWRNDDGGDGNNAWLIQMPVLRVVYSGRYMVTIFFVISGYVLSHKALGLARQRQFAPLLKSLSSSVFRRWLRLMLPALTSSFIGFLLVRAHFALPLYSDWAAPKPLNPHDTAPEKTFEGARLPARMDSTALQFWDWAASSRAMVDPFRFGAIEWPKYNIVLWTMQVEYMGSMLVFVTVLGIALARPRFRIAITSSLVIYCVLTGQWIWSLFICGVLFAELSHESSSKTLLPTTVVNKGTTEKIQISKPRNGKLQRFIPDTIAFIFLLFIGTYPEYDAEASPGYRHLSKLIPAGFEKCEGQFYPMLSAMLVIFFLENTKSFQGLFTTRIAQYLGDISLSLYMLHTHIELSFGNWIVPICLNLASGFGTLYFVVGMSGESIPPAASYCM